MHLLDERFVFERWWSWFSGQGSQELSNGTNVASQLANVSSVFTFIVHMVQSYAIGFAKSHVFLQDEVVFLHNILPKHHRQELVVSYVLDHGDDNVSRFLEKRKSWENRCNQLHCPEKPPPEAATRHPEDICLQINNSNTVPVNKGWRFPRGSELIWRTTDVCYLRTRAVKEMLGITSVRTCPRRNNTRVSLIDLISVRQAWIR